jgi:hypothetical protein
MSVPRRRTRRSEYFVDYCLSVRTLSCKDAYASQATNHLLYSRAKRFRLLDSSSPTGPSVKHMTNSRSFQRVVTLFNILFGLIAVGIVIGVFKYLLVIFALWFAGARLLSMAIAASVYLVIFVLSLIMRRRGFESWKAVAWALSPVIGLFGIAISATFLFGICSRDSLQCAMPVAPQILPSRGVAQYTPAEIETSRRAQTLADENQRRSVAVNKCANEKLNVWKTQNPEADQKQGLTKLLEISKECIERFPSAAVAQAEAPVQAQPTSGPVKTFGGSKEEIARNRIIDIHACTNKLLDAWFKNGEPDHSPDRQRQKTNYFSNACAAGIDGTGPMPGTSIIDTPTPGDNKVNQAAVSEKPTHPRVYRCSGPGGTTVFTDMPCAPDSATQ